MAKLSRNVLKKFFENGNLLSQNEFSDLIDSSWNINDDGLNKTSEEGFQLGPGGSSQKIMSFYKSNLEGKPSWQLAIDNNRLGGLSFVQLNKDQNPSLFLADNGNSGIGTTNPETTLDVYGSISSKARIGSYIRGKVKADAQWYTIIEGLRGCNIFEIVARAVGNQGDGNYTMAHAIALNANQGKRGKIKVIHSSFSWYDFRDKIKLRWIGTPNNYSLQIRTGKHYFMSKTEGVEHNYLSFHVVKLWDDELIFEDLYGKVNVKK